MALFGRKKKADAGDSAGVVLQRSEHRVSRSDIDRNALDVLYRLHQNGHVACLVGGAVRDLLLKRKPKDFDVGTTAHPNQVRRLFRNCFLVGRRFRLAHLRFGNKIIETSTFRRKPEPVDATPEEEASLYLHHDNTYGTPEEDARRRDFTVNGLFYDIDGFKVVDYVGGLQDLERRLIRTIGDPDVRLCEDPVRMLRAVRFAARLGFTIERGTWDAILRNHAEILKSSPARLYEEFVKQFTYGGGVEAVRLMQQSGLLDDLMPGIARYLAHAGDGAAFFWRCLEVLDQQNADVQSPRDALVLSALCYPIFLEKIADSDEGKGRGNPRVIAQNVLRAVSPVVAMPRKTFFQVVYIMMNQPLFDRWDEGRPASRRHFVKQLSFMDSDRFRDLLLAVDGQEIPEHKPWMDLYHECAAEQEQGVEPTGPQEDRPRHRRRRRRGRRREC